jgi:hypothetical protein
MDGRVCVCRKLVLQDLPDGCDWAEGQKISNTNLLHLQKALAEDLNSILQQLALLTRDKCNELATKHRAVLRDEVRSRIRKAMRAAQSDGRYRPSFAPFCSALTCACALNCSQAVEAAAVCNRPRQSHGETNCGRTCFWSCVCA